MKAKDIRKGTIIIQKGVPFSVAEFQHRTPGNLRAFVQVKMRNLLTGATVDTRFSTTEDIEVGDIYAFPATYLFADEIGFHFMNSQTYEETIVPVDLIGEGKYFLQDSMSVEVTTYDEKPIGVRLPKSVVLTVVDTEPELRGATAGSSYKPAKTDTGLTVTVPPFIKIGEKIVVDTEESKYLSRADDKK